MRVEDYKQIIELCLKTNKDLESGIGHGLKIYTEKRLRQNSATKEYLKT